MKIDAPYADALPVGHVVRESLSGGSKCRGEIGIQSRPDLLLRFNLLNILL